MLMKPSLLILDEASSALDAETERRIQSNLLGTGESRTTIAVAHRLSTIRNADRIIVLENGVVVEDGEHEDLLQLSGVYARLWAVQTGENIS